MIPELMLQQYLDRGVNGAIALSPVELDSDKRIGHAKALAMLKFVRIIRIM